jgi:hypothetical protein
MTRTSLALMVSLCCLAAGVSAADKTRVVNEGGIRDQWMLADGVKIVSPGYPAQFKDRGDDVCIALAYAINPDGTTGDFALLREWSSAPGANAEKGYFDTFASAGAVALSQWKFKPKPEVEKPQRTVTVATLHFMGKGSIALPLLRAKCEVGDLASVIKEARNSPAERERLRRDMERANREASAAQSQVANPAGSLGRPIGGGRTP